MTILEKITDRPQLVLTSSDFRQLEQIYNYRNKQQVQQFLKNHPELVKFLVDSRDHLLKYFGDEAKFFLEVVRDPEATGILEALFVNISTQMSVEDALNQLDELDRDWHFDNLHWLGGILNFSLEIQ
jgi:hypothetical protein